MDKSADPSVEVDDFVRALAPEVPAPAIRRRDAVLVTGPWLAGSTAMVSALSDRLPDLTFVEAAAVRPGEAPLAVVFVTSAAAPLTASDCAVLDAAAAHTDIVIGVVSKIDAHHNWRDVLDADRAAVAAHSSRYTAIPWVGAAAAPELGAPRCDELITALTGALDTSVPRRNRLRAWEVRLDSALRQQCAEVAGAGRESRVARLQAERIEVARAARAMKSERTIALRSQIQQARVQLSYFARNRCNSVRTELQEDAAEVTRRGLPQFLAYVDDRVGAVVDEVDAGITEHLANVARELGLPEDRTAPSEPVQPDIGAPQLHSRRLETRLMVLVGAGFGLGVALTLTRLFADLAPGLAVLGGVGCAVIGVLAAVWMVGTRALLHDRAVLDRWIGELSVRLRAAVDRAVATQVLVAEMSLTSALTHQVAAEQDRVARQLRAIDDELRAHTVARAQAMAAHERTLPALRNALTAVRAELGQREVTGPPAVTPPGVAEAEPHTGSGAGPVAPEPTRPAVSAGGRGGIETGVG